MPAHNAPHIKVGDRYDQFTSHQVFSCRIGVHTLGRQGGKLSENHVTLYLLVGRGNSVRVDMRPDALNTGELDLSGRAYTRSTHIVNFIDVAAANCPSGFHADSTPSRVGSRPTVSDFIDCISRRNLQFFRFLFVGGHSIGCRSWA